MNIGDRVRVLHGREEGIIRNLINDKTIEIEIEDGFLIQIYKREVVLIASEETHIFDKKEDKRVNETTVLSGEGIYLAFTGHNDNLKCFLVNNTDFELLVSLTSVKDGKHQGLLGAHLPAKKATQVMQNIRLSDMETLPNMLLQVIFHHENWHTPKEAFVKTIKLKASNIQASKQIAPVLKQEGYLLQLDTDLGNVKKMQENLQNATKPSAYAKLKVEKEVDLHIEKLSNEYLMLTPYEMLTIQLDTFQKHLDNAIAMQLAEIVFIHGIGNGTLKTEIYKRLSKNKGIKTYKEAPKEKYGNGATLVMIK